MKKLLSALTAIILSLTCLGALSGCGNNKNDKLSIVTTIFPLYDWTREIAGDADVDISVLMTSGMDMHSYQPAPSDLLAIANCDLLIYVGGESDDWVEDALQNSNNKNRKVINLMSCLDDLIEEDGDLEDGDHDHDHDHGDEGVIENDEHIWLSVKRASKLCGVIAEELAVLCPEYGEDDPDTSFEANLASYREKLNTLDGEYAQAVEQGNKDTVLFADRFPFIYMCNDYGINYRAALSGCSSTATISPSMLQSLIGSVNELSLSAIVILEGSDDQYATYIRDNSEAKNQKILRMNSMQSVTAAQIKSGVKYLSIMESNLEVLKEALS